MKPASRLMGLLLFTGAMACMAERPAVPAASEAPGPGYNAPALVPVDSVMVRDTAQPDPGR
jgi:hypothetical protein